MKELTENQKRFAYLLKLKEHEVKDEDKAEWVEAQSKLKEAIDKFYPK